MVNVVTHHSATVVNVVTPHSATVVTLVTVVTHHSATVVNVVTLPKTFNNLKVINIFTKIWETVVSTR